MTCEDLKNWGDLDRDQRADLMQDLLARIAIDYDVPVPELVLGPAPDNPETPQNEADLPAAYDAANNVMYFNRLSEWTFKDDPSELLTSAGHEFGHELFDETYSGNYDLSTPEGRQELNDASEQYADSYENMLADEIKDGCDPEPPQSPGEPDIEPDDDSDDEPDDGDPKPPRNPRDWALGPGETGVAGG
jgi:hypothetical protein